jgi:hypothetical protein
VSLIQILDRLRWLVLQSIRRSLQSVCGPARCARCVGAPRALPLPLARSAAAAAAWLLLSFDRAVHPAALRDGPADRHSAAGG